MIETFDACLISRLPESERLGDCGQNKVGIANRREWNEADPTGKVFGQSGRYSQTQRRFTNTTCTSQRHEARLWLSQQGDNLLYFLLAPNQRSKLGRQIECHRFVLVQVGDKWVAYTEV